MRSKRVDNNQGRCAIIFTLGSAASERKILAARANLLKAVEANKKRPSTLMDKTCPVCQNVFKVKPSHFEIKTYCGKTCMATGYKTRMRGSGNPNFRNAAAGKFCQQCGIKFESYEKTRKFCSYFCYIDSIPDLIKRLGRAGIDINQKEIVEALRAVGVSVYISSGLGKGFPDLIAGYQGVTKLLEVKNLTNAYGRKGFNENQLRWNAQWRGELPIIVTNVKEAMDAMGIVTNIKEALAVIGGQLM